MGHASADPYPEYDDIAGTWQVVEPVNDLMVRVWWGSSPSRSYMRYTAAWRAMEDRNRSAASPRHAPSRLGSRFD